MQSKIDQRYREKWQYTATILLKVKLFFYNSNSGLQYDTQEILDDQNLHESTIEALNAIVSEISKKNRLIRTTDCSLPGWVTIAEYEDGPFASNSEDSKKLRQT